MREKYPGRENENEDNRWTEENKINTLYGRVITITMVRKREKWKTKYGVNTIMHREQDTRHRQFHTSV